MDSQKPRSKANLKSVSSSEEVIHTQKTGQIDYAVQSFMMFLHGALQNKILTMAYVEEMKNRLSKLKQSLEVNKLSTQKAFLQLNQWIDETNGKLPKFPEQNPYPHFDQEFLNHQVSDQILAFQNYLFQIMKMQHLPLALESTIFTDAFKLWEKVFYNSLNPKSGVAALSKLIDKANGQLQEKDKYPKPNENFYSL